MPIGELVRCRVSNNGDFIWFFKRWFMKTSEFLFQRGVYYTKVVQNNKIFVIDRTHVPHEFELNTFNILFKKV